MKYIHILVLVLLTAFTAVGQSDLQKMVDTEHTFAQMAAEKGTRAAFLENLADDGFVFVTDKTNGKIFWTARAPAMSLLSWAPNYADISSNGTLGYTTGNWEFRAKGKDDTPSAFGDFITLWLRQPSGKYKFVIDIGIGHAKPEKYSAEWTTSDDKIPDKNGNDRASADFGMAFYQLVTAKGLNKAYEMYAADNIRAYREDKLPILGKKNLKSVTASDKSTVIFANRGVFFSSADLAYMTNTYTKLDGEKIVEKGNFMQIWKLSSGKWQIVLDIFKPVPSDN